MSFTFIPPILVRLAKLLADKRPVYHLKIIDGKSGLAIP
jgi:hypothetical protein